MTASRQLLLISLGMLVATASWGLNFHLAKVMLQYVGGFESAFWRYAWAMPIFVYMLPGLRQRWPAWRTLWPLLLLAGVVGLAGFNFFFFLGVQGTTAVNSALIVNINPALTAILAWLVLGSRITAWHWTGLAVALFGVVIIVAEGSLAQVQDIQFTASDGLLLITSVLFAIYHVAVRKYRERLSNRHLTAFTSVVCWLTFAALAPAWDGLHLPGHWGFWLAAAGFGTVGTAVAYIFWNQGVSQLGPARASVYVNMVPIFAAVFASAFGEELHLYHLWASLCIIGGLLLVQLPAFISKR